jgi:predicted metal-dependent phosphoesterase TrpH
MLKIDLHVHTEYSDGVSSIKRILKTAEEKCLDGIAITDHGTLDGWKKAYKIKSDLIIIPGLEIQTRQGHIQALGLKKIPFSIDEDLTIFEVAEKMRNRESLIIIPHSRTPLFSTKRETIEKLKPDALEVINSLSPFFNRNKRLCTELAEKLGIPKVAGSDSHRHQTVGNAYTLIDSKSKKTEDVLKAIKEGKTQVYGKSSPLRYKARLPLKIIINKLSPTRRSESHKKSVKNLTIKPQSQLTS